MPPHRLASPCSLLLVAGLSQAALAQNSGITVRGWTVLDSRWNDGPYVEIDAGPTNTIALRPDGTCAVWGHQAYSQCTPPTQPAGVTFVGVSAASQRMQALRSDGQIIEWGSSALVPPPLPLGSSYEQVSSGQVHSVALRTGGVLVAWGGNNLGQCNLPPPPIGGSFVEVDAGWQHSLALTTYGRIAGWGANASGQCDVPALPPNTVYVDFSAGGDHSVALRSDGRIVAWGNNQFGQCNAPATPAALRYVEVSAGHRFSLARRSDGSVVAWGANEAGQCVLPQELYGARAIQISAGSDHGAALLEDRSVVMWGSSTFGQTNIPRLPPGTEYIQASELTACGLALRSDGRIVTWGVPWTGELEVPALPPGTKYVHDSIGSPLCYDGVFSVARRSDGVVVAWGSNSYGQCNMPTLGAGLRCESMEVDGVRTFMLLSNGTLSVHGAGGSHRVGTPLPPATRYVEFDVGSGRVMARRSDGAVLVWQSDSIPLTVPPAPVGTQSVHIAAAHPLGWGLLNDGRLFQFSDGVIATPPAGVRYLDLAVGELTCALRSDGRLALFTPHPNLPVVPDPPPGKAYISVNVGLLHMVAVYSGAQLPASYCTAKVNSLGCTPTVTWQGSSSAGIPSGFVLSASLLRNREPGVLMYGFLGRAALPFLQGTLCVQPPVHVLPLASAGGSPPWIADCTGFLEVDMNAFASGALGWNPPAALSIPGTRVDCQFWCRDSGLPPPNDASLTDAIEYFVGV